MLHKITVEKYLVAKMHLICKVYMTGAKLFLVLIPEPNSNIKMVNCSNKSTMLFPIGITRDLIILWIPIH